MRKTIHSMGVVKMKIITIQGRAGNGKTKTMHLIEDGLRLQAKRSDEVLETWWASPLKSFYNLKANILAINCDAIFIEECPPQLLINLSKIKSESTIYATIQQTKEGFNGDEMIALNIIENTPCIVLWSDNKAIGNFEDCYDVAVLKDAIFNLYEDIKRLR